MSLATYSDLQDAVARWLRRSDLTAAIPDFITLAETRFNRELRLRSMETSQSGTLSTGTLAVPSDLIKLQKLTVTVNGVDNDLTYMAPKNMTRYSGYTSIPRAFTTINQVIQIAPVPDGSYPYVMNYVAKVPSLSNTNTTNLILTNAPDVYLYASLMEAAPYLKDDARVPLWAAAYQNAIDKLEEADEQQQFPDEVLVVKGDVRL